MKKKFHCLEVNKVFAELKTSPKGLSSKEVLIRLKKYGYNKLTEGKKFSILNLFLTQFKNPLIYILFVALFISFASGHSTDGWIVFAVIFLSTMVGFLQEYKANTALSQLKNIIKYKAKVIRENKELILHQEDLVPGDIIILNSGDKVPADARLIEVQDLEVIEASLTGESMPIEKTTKILDTKTVMADRKNMVYLGTIIAKGKAKAVVTATGTKTEIGHIANMVNETKEGMTPLQKQMFHFGKVIGVVLVIINLFVFGLGVLFGKDVFEMFLTSVAMVVAAVPEGLLPAMTVILAVSMQKLAKQKGLVRKMLATETLGSVSVICSDKTGTLTQGEMRVAEIITEKKKLSHHDHKFSEIIEPDGDASHITALKISLLCNDAIIENPNDEIHKWIILGNPTEKALLLASRAAGLHKEVLEKQTPRIAEIPFESENKYMVTAHKVDQDKVVLYMKGALERVLPFVSFLDEEGEKIKMTDAKKEKIQKECDNLTSTGLRVIAVGYKLEKQKKELFNLKKEGLKDFVFVGLIAIKDPLRTETKETIELCKNAGIRLVMITGDHKLTAVAIGKELGLKVGSNNVMEGLDLDKISDQEFSKIVKNIHIFARVEPRHKIRIVTALQANGEIVAMTGDGINDAPALKKADIGIAVGSGTDVAKETADLVLLDDNFKTIVEAVQRGRGTFDNIRKVVLYLLSSSLTEIILISLSLVFGLPLALLPVQILWMKMIEEPLPAMSLAFDPINKNVMKRQPRKINEEILNKNLKKMLLFFALISDVLLFSLFYFSWQSTQDIVYAQTIAFVGLGIASRFYIFAARGLSNSIFSYNPFKNQLVNWSIVLGFVFTLIAVYTPFFNKILHTTPIGLKEWGILLFFGLISLTVYEIGKKLFLSNKIYT